MFKGLKSKLEDEAKKLQATVQSTVAQYGESLSHQVGHIRSGAASDAGSESSASVSKRFFGFGSNNENDSSGPSHSVGGALMEEVTEGDLLGLDIPQRERTLSGGSNHSNESSFSTLFSSVPGMPVSTLDPIDSDVESAMDEHGSAVVNSASKEQISSVLRKLQGRAANYKDKYRDLVKQYNEVVTENNKCRAVLAQTQDKALTRIDKLRNERKVLLEQDQETQKRLTKYEDMLKKCTDEIRRNRAKITELSEGNTGSNQGENSEESDRIVLEWKKRVEKLEEEWTERLNKAETDAALTLAQSKADMHGALESKDREVELLRQKCRTLEIQDGQANERWQKKVDELKVIISSLETEKSEMIEKLSEAKVQGVKAVRDEEEAKRKDLEANIAQIQQDHTQEVAQLKEKLEKLQNATLESSENDSLSRDKLNDLENSLKRLTEENARKIEELTGTHEMSLEEQKIEYENKVAELSTDLNNAKTDFRKLHEDYENLKKQNVDEKKDEETEIQELQRKLENAEQEGIQSQERVTVIEEKCQTLSNELEKAREVIAELSTLRNTMEIEIREAKKMVDELTNSASNDAAESGAEVLNLKQMLKERNVQLEDSAQQIGRLQSELEKVKENLTEEIEDIKNQRDEVQRRVDNLETSLDQAQRNLEEARSRLEDEKTALEEEINLMRNRLPEVIPVAPDLLEECLIKVDEPVLAAEPVSQVEIDQLKNELQIAEQNYEVLKEERHSVMVELDSVKADFEQIRRKSDEHLKSYEERMKSLEEICKEQKDQLSTLEKEKDGFLEKWKIEEEEFTEKSKLFDQALSNEKEKVQDLQAQLENNQQRLQFLNEQLNKKEKDHDQTLASEQEKARTLEAQLEENHQQLKALKEQLSQKDMKLDQSVAGEQQQVKALETYEQKLIENEGKLQELNDRLQQKDGELILLQNERASLIEEVKTLKDGSLDKEKELQVKLEASVQREELLHASIENAQREIEVLKKTQPEMSASKRINELEELGDRMRSEFLEKEEIVAELRKELEQSRLHTQEINNKLSSLEEERSNLQDQLSNAHSTLTDKAQEVHALTQKFETFQNDMKTEIEKKDAEHDEGLKIREQYSSALENHRTNEEELGKRVTEKETENRKLHADLENLTKEFNEYREQQQKEQDTAVSELKKKAEGKLGKMKKEFEKDVAAAKSELLLKVDEHRTALSEKEKKLDEMRIEKAKLEQQLIGEEELRKELSQERQNNEQIMTQMKLLEGKLAEVSALEKDLKEMQVNNRETIDEKEKLVNKVAELEMANEETMKKVAVKQDLESKKVIRELQREVKQLYAELTDKSTALDEANSQIRELENKATNQQVHPSENHSKASTNKGDEAHELDQEEINSLKRRLTDAHKEIDVLRENRHATKNNNSDDNTFAHPTEQEYLRNVLYRYMNERETLGKEIVTLARVIGTVTRFSKKQLDDVLTKEENRAASWGQTLSTVSNPKH
ncbi:unnamed protein product, partial [Mesorhabditis belari]|uniref:GRIP domain-containing protein n=1 Tax=Mesorhabditis belari TaxID=2138241 RepID=A0AAF3EBN0_9BILA